MKGTFRKGLASLLALSLTLGMGTAFAAPAALPEEDASEPEQNVAEDAVDYSAYEPGVTVEADENSPTGYTATFIYEEQSLEVLNAYVSYNTAKPQEETSSVTLTGDVAKVEIYSDCFMLFDPEDPEMEKGVRIAEYADKGLQPYDYQAGLVPAGGNGQTAVSIELEEFADGMWGVQVPLSTYTTAALEIREGDRTQRYDLGPLTSLDPDAFVLFGEQETAPFSVDMGGAVSVTAEHPRVRITCLSPEQVWPESAWLSVQITGQAEELYPLTLVEDSQGVWLGHTDPEVIPLTLEAGELVDVTLHMVDNWGRETTQGSSISFLARAE